MPRKMLYLRRPSRRGLGLASAQWPWHGYSGRQPYAYVNTLALTLLTLMITPVDAQPLLISSIAMAYAWNNIKQTSRPPRLKKSEKTKHDKQTQQAQVPRGRQARATRPGGGGQIGTCMAMKSITAVSRSSKPGEAVNRSWQSTTTLALDVSEHAQSGNAQSLVAAADYSKLWP